MTYGRWVGEFFSELEEGGSSLDVVGWPLKSLDGNVDLWLG